MLQTYDEILKAMTDKYTELSGIVPAEASDIAIRLRVLAGELYSGAVNLQWLKRQMFSSTASGEYLDMHAEERGITRRKATVSYGKVTFSLGEPLAENVSIPKGTVLKAADSVLRFETTQNSAIYAGDVSATVPVKSLGEGKKYNVGKGTVSVMVTPVTGVEKVTNTAAFTGGCDSESDESLRERIKQSLIFPLNSANCTYYKAVAESVEGVSSAGVVPRGRGAGTVDVYISADGSKASSATVSAVQELLETRREVNVDVLVKEATASVVNIYVSLKVLEGYDFDVVRNSCIEAITDYIDSRGVGGEVLLCHISKVISEVEGVKEFSYVNGLNSDFRASADRFPTTGVVSISRGTV